MKITNSLNLPEYIFKGLCDAYLSHSKPEENEISVTTLNKPDGMIVISRKYDEDIEVDVKDIITSALGTIIHDYFERHAKECGLMTEQTVVREVDAGVNKYKITGRYDQYDPKLEELYDIKFTKVATFEKNRDGRDDDWLKQGSSYSERLEAQGHPVKKFTNICFLADYSAIKQNASSPIQLITHDMTTPESRDYMADVLDYQNWKVEKFDRNRNLDDSELPMCSAEERWEDQSYAVMKEGRKSAVRCFATEDEAKAFIETIDKDKDKHSVVKRGGNPIRCTHYCTIREFCPYYRNNVVKGEDE